MIGGAEGSFCKEGLLDFRFPLLLLLNKLHQQSTLGKCFFYLIAKKRELRILALATWVPKIWRPFCYSKNFDFPIGADIKFWLILLYLLGFFVLV